MKPFQERLTAWALRRGKAAIFAETGLGKTLMQLGWADNVARIAGPVLILTPLAVAEQTVTEAAKFGIDGVAHVREPAGARISVTNYERFDRFDVSEFAGIVLDESSIIKSHDSKTRKHLIEACAEIRYKLCCTATPAPNDHAELGNHAEFLDVMSEKEMLATFFIHDGGIRAGGGTTAEWRLKGHAERAFWRWLSTWGAVVRNPRDLGDDAEGYDLPPLRRHQVTVEAKASEGSLLAGEARTLGDRLKARRESVTERVSAAADVVKSRPRESWIVWCNLNAESEALARAIQGALEVRGSDDEWTKTRRLTGFCRGEPRVLVSKPSIAGFGLNWQHCHNVVFVGLNDSFEQQYQAIRRCWRFGQQLPVDVWMIASEREGAVVANVEAKEAAFEQMHAAMADGAREFLPEALRGTAGGRIMAAANERMRVPSWLT